MPLEDRDLSYLLDMMSSCQDIVEFTTGVSFEEFDREKMRKLATERQLEILGERDLKHRPTGQPLIFVG